MIKRFAGILAIAALVLTPYLAVIPAWTPAVAALANFTAISLIGLNAIFGMLGLHALGQAAFMGLAGYSTGILLAHAVPIWLALPLSVVTTVLIAAGLARVFIRLPGNFFAFGTIGFAFVVEGLARAFPEITGGASGMVFTSSLRLTSVEWYTASLLALVVALVSYRLLVRGAFERRLQTVRSDELSAEVIGVNVARTKTLVFTLGAVYAAVSGILLSYFVGVVVPESGGVERSLELVAMLMIGGSGTLLGPVVGASLVGWLATIAGAAGLDNHLEVFVYGLGFFLAAMFAPRGIVGLFAAQPIVSKPTAAVHLHRAQPVHRESAAPEPAILQVRQISKSFGGVQAVRSVDLDVSVGEVVVLIGPNGAGKTTLFNLISGIEPADAGEVLLGDTDIVSMPVHQRARLMGRSFQVPRLVPELSVIENVVARLDQLDTGLSEDERMSVAMQQLERFDLASLAHASLSSLSAGQQKIIDVVRSSLGASQLLLLDEPAVGLTQKELSDLASMILELRRSTAILVVEHNFRFVEQIADRALVLDRGSLIASGTLAAVTANTNVRTAYYGALA